MSSTTTDWFRVDKKGLSQLIERRGMAWIVFELLSNAWDEKSTKVEVMLTPHDGKPLVTITVSDDNPEGFADLRDAWTLFAASKKKGDAEKRGRFNLGEKLVLAMCESAIIRTTTGAVLFDKTGRQNRSQWKTPTGSIFEADVRMTRAQLADVEAELRKLIPPPIVTKVNGRLIEWRMPLVEFEATLPTEISDETGVMRRSARRCKVQLFPPLDGEEASIYELGIPVVATGDAFHVNVMQKVPLNMERDNVTPAYLRELRALVVTHAHVHLAPEQKRDTWVTDAISAPTFDPHAGNALAEIVSARFGDARVSYDPSDHEANQIAASKGLTVVHGGSLPAAAWEKIRQTNLIQPAGQVTPSPKPFAADGRPLKLADAKQITPLVTEGIAIYTWLARKLLGFEPDITLAHDRGWPFRASWTKSTLMPGLATLTLNLARLDESHFRSRAEIYRLAIHEFAHHKVSSHLDEAFHAECCRLGAKLAALFDDYGGGASAITDDTGVLCLNSTAGL